MNPATLAALIKAKRLAKLGNAVKDGPELDADCEAIAEAVVEHITAAAVVTVPLGVPVQVLPATGTGATTAPGTGKVS